VISPTTQDVKLLKKLEKTFDEKAFPKEMKSLCFKHDRNGVNLLNKGLYSPIININGFHAGYTSSGTKTVLPRKATAKIDIRFGPNMEPQEVVEKFRNHFLEQEFDDIEQEDRIDDGLDMWYGKAQSNPEFPRRFVYRTCREAHLQIFLWKRQTKCEKESGLPLDCMGIKVRAARKHSNSMQKPCNIQPAKYLHKAARSRGS